MQRWFKVGGEGLVLSCRLRVGGLRVARGLCLAVSNQPLATALLRLRHSLTPLGSSPLAAFGARGMLELHFVDPLAHLASHLQDPVTKCGGALEL